MSVEKTYMIKFGQKIFQNKVEAAIQNSHEDPYCWDTLKSIMTTSRAEAFEEAPEEIALAEALPIEIVLK